MRGTPFLKKGFQLGLNTQDSPYELTDGETRECLNVVSTSRGAVHKRNGFRKLFTPSAVSGAITFTTLFSLEGITEKPFTGAHAVNFLNVNGMGEIRTAAWRPAEPLRSVESVLYEEGFFPAIPGGKVVSLKLKGKSESQEGFVEKPEQSGFGLWLVSSTSAGKVQGYFLRFMETGAVGSDTFTVRIIRFDNQTYDITKEADCGGTVLETVTGIKLEENDVFAFSEQEGILKGWKEHAAAWTNLITAHDGKYACARVGWSAVSARALANTHVPLLRQFKVGEMPEGTPPIKATTVKAVDISGTRYIIAAGEGKVYAIDTAGEYHLLKSGLNTTAKWEVVQATENSADKTPGLKKGGPIWMVNGVDKPLYWKGSTAEEAQTWTGESTSEYYEDSVSKEHVPNGKYMVLLGNHIFMAGMTTEPYTVRWTGFAESLTSGLSADPTSWEKLNFQPFDSDDGEPITGLGVVGKYVLVFKRTKTYVIYNLEEGLMRQVSDQVGCISHRSIVETPEGAFFLSQRGIYATNGASVKEIAYKVRPTVKLAENDTAAAGAYFNNHYYLSFTGTEENGTTVSQTLDYDMVLRSWWLHDCYAKHWTEWLPGTESTLVGACTTAVATAFVPNLFTDFGAAYTGRTLADGEKWTAYWVSPWESFAYFVYRRRIEASFIRKRLRQVMVDGSGTIRTAYSKDFSEVTLENIAMQGDEEAVGAGNKEPTYAPTNTESEARRHYGLGVGRTWSLTLGNCTAADFHVNAYTLMVDFKKS